MYEEARDKLEIQQIQVNKAFKAYHKWAKKRALLIYFSLSYCILTFLNLRQS